DLLSLDVLLHRGFDARAYFVGIRRRVELVGRLLLDQLLGELQLRLLHLGLRDLDVLDRAHFARVKQLLHYQAVFDRTDHYDVLLAARRPAAQRAALGFAQRAREQRIGLGAALVGREIVGLVEEHRIDRVDRHEFGDFGALSAR